MNRLIKLSNFFLKDGLGVVFIDCKDKLMQEENADVNNIMYPHRSFAGRLIEQ